MTALIYIAKHDIYTCTSSLLNRWTVFKDDSSHFEYTLRPSINSEYIRICNNFSHPWWNLNLNILKGSGHLNIWNWKYIHISAISSSPMITLKHGWFWNTIAHSFAANDSNSWINMSNAKNRNSCCLDQCLPLLKNDTITPNGVIGFTSVSLALGSVLSVRRLMINVHNVQHARPLTHKPCLKCFYINLISF